MNKRTTLGISLAAALACSGALFGVASATEVPPDPQVVVVKTQVACGTVTVTLTNNDTGAYGFDWHTVPWNGGNVGVKSGSLTVAAGATVTNTIHLKEDSYDGKGAFTLGVVFGPNTHKQPFLDLGLVVTDCKPPVTETTKPAPTTDPTVAPTTTAAPTTTTAPPTTPARDDKDCADFPTQAAAQAVLDADKIDPNHLDTNHNGIACEGPADPTPPLPTILPVPVANPQFEVVPNTTSGVNTGDGSLA
jgi:hypothetical protein